MKYLLISLFLDLIILVPIHCYYWSKFVDSLKEERVYEMCAAEKKLKRVENVITWVVAFQVVLMFNYFIFY